MKRAAEEAKEKEAPSPYGDVKEDPEVSDGFLQLPLRGKSLRIFAADCEKVEDVHAIDLSFAALVDEDMDSVEILVERLEGVSKVLLDNNDLCGDNSDIDNPFLRIPRGRVSTPAGHSLLHSYVMSTMSLTGA